MKSIVVYKSGTGFTEKYAGWIADELKCEAVELKDFKKFSPSDFDLVVFGGWIMGGCLMGFDKIKVLNLKNLVVFGVGMSLPSEENRKKIVELNVLDDENFFYLEGGYNPQKLGFFKKLLMKIIKKSLENKVEKTKDDIHVLEAFSGVDNSDKASIKPLIERCSSFL